MNEIRDSLLAIANRIRMLTNRVTQLEAEPKVRTDYLGLAEQSTDPADPDEGDAVIWLSDGTGTGDAGDVMIKITSGAVTKTDTLVDFSAI